MQPGKIWVADHEGVYVIKLVGDVRLTLCVSFDGFIKSMFGHDDFHSVVFDLTEAEGIDSTTLGLMAKISIQSKQGEHLCPTVISTSPGITRLLESMGFDEIFNVISGESASLDGATCLEAGELDEREVKEKILEAHRVLMGLNEQNSETFKDLVQALEHS
jgi:anti-anti-sigma factor